MIVKDVYKKKKSIKKMNQNDREERFIGRSSVVLAHASVPVDRITLKL